MTDRTEELIAAVDEIRSLLRLIAEPQIAARDQKFREELLKIVGKSAPKAKATLLMKGAASQAEIHKKTGIHKGHLSDLVKALGKANLLKGDPKLPELSILVPEDFFGETLK